MKRKLTLESIFHNFPDAKPGCLLKGGWYFSKYIFRECDFPDYLFYARDFEEYISTFVDPESLWTSENLLIRLSYTSTHSPMYAPYTWSK